MSGTKTNEKIVAICGTYRRHKLIPNVLAQWNLQKTDNFDKQLIICDDGEDFQSDEFEDVEILSLPRFSTLGDKWNFMAERAINKYGATHIAIWDDDDIYGPEYLLNHIRTFRENLKCDFSSSKNFYMVYADRTETEELKNSLIFLHCAWCFSSEIYSKVQYPSVSVAFDTEYGIRAYHDHGAIFVPTLGERMFGYRWFSTEYANTSPTLAKSPDLPVIPKTIFDPIVNVKPEMDNGTLSFWKDRNWL